MFTPHIIRFQEIDSTNSEAKRNLKTAPEGTVWTAHYQTQGRGQYDRKWVSAPSQNILATLLLRPTFLPANLQHHISQCTALGLCDFLISYQLDARIKWPNDIYIGPNKICGILIEHQLSGNNMVSSIIGFGININQTQFNGAPNPTSLTLETGLTFQAEDLLPKVLQEIQKWYQRLQDGDTAIIDSTYQERLVDISLLPQNKL